MEFIYIDCKDCNGILSEVPFEKQTVERKEFQTEEEAEKSLMDYFKKGINNFGKCQHCNKDLTPNFNNNQNG